MVLRPRGFSQIYVRIGLEEQSRQSGLSKAGKKAKPQAQSKYPDPPPVSVSVTVRDHQKKWFQPQTHKHGAPPPLPRRNKVRCAPFRTGHNK